MIIKFILFLIYKLPVEWQIDIARELAEKYLSESLGISPQKLDFAQNMLKKLIK